jgi:LPXTG-motif cell wall-anchored protein
MEASVITYFDNETNLLIALILLLAIGFFFLRKKGQRKK